jgi:uncharacterized protein (TIGR02996 family)
VTDRDAFLAAIHAAPDDDAPRLVYSDWLEENGQPERAEFIRIQIAMFQEHAAHGRRTPRLDEMFLRQKELFNRPWADTLRRCGAGAVSTYSRGFSTDAFRMPAEAFAREAADLVGWFGPRPHLVLHHCQGMLAAVAARAELRWIHTLSLTQDWRQPDVADADLTDLCRSPHLAAIRELHVTGGGRTGPALTAASCRALAGAATLTGLEVLGLARNNLGNDGAAALADAEPLRTLRVLDLRQARIGRRGMDALMRSAVLTNLERLQLGGNQISESLEARLRDRFGPALDVGTR